MSNQGIFFKEFQAELQEKATDASVAVYKIEAKNSFKNFDFSNPGTVYGTDLSCIPPGSVVKYETAADNSLTVCFYIPDESYDLYECIRIKDDEINVFSCKTYLEGLNSIDAGYLECTEFTWEDILDYCGIELDDEEEEEEEEDCDDEDEDYDDGEDYGEEEEEEDDYDPRDDIPAEILDAWDESDSGSVWRINCNGQYDEWYPEDVSEDIAFDLLREDAVLYTMDGDKEALHWLEKYKGKYADEVKQAIVDIIARYHLEM
jgi:hypothetical protein